MASKQKIEFTCDLCKYPAKAFATEVEAKRAGWLVVGCEHYHLDRSFFDAHVCPSCASKVLTAMEAAKLAIRTKQGPA